MIYKMSDQLEYQKYWICHFKLKSYWSKAIFPYCYRISSPYYWPSISPTGVHLKCWRRSFLPCGVSLYWFPDVPVTLPNSSMMSLSWAEAMRGLRRQQQQPEWELRHSWSHRKYIKSVRRGPSLKRASYFPLCEIFQPFTLSNTLATIGATVL